MYEVINFNEHDIEVASPRCSGRSSLPEARPLGRVPADAQIHGC